ncbi:MAG: hypothetical protein QGG09_14935, partial [Pirellulaceae bacterium]|nr:hypothetical protein [Pirellulaceae bacterium]
EAAMTHDFNREASEAFADGLDGSKERGRHYQRLAEEARLRTLDRSNELLAIENGLRKHAPSLLGLVPVVDVFEPVPADLKPLAATMRDIEGKFLDSTNIPPGKLSTPMSPDEASKLFKCGPRAFVKHVESGVIRAKKLSSKSYQVHIDDLPKTLR